MEKQKGSSTKNIGIVNIENYRMRKIIEKLDHLVDISIVDSDRKGKWKRALQHYHELMIILRKKGAEYTSEELLSFEHHCDNFFQLWVELHGRAGVCN